MTEVRQATIASSEFGGLVDVLDTIIDGGAVVAGDIVIALDGVDLIRLDVRVLLAGIQGTAEPGEVA